MTGSWIELVREVDGLLGCRVGLVGMADEVGGRVGSVVGDASICMDWGEASGSGMEVGEVSGSGWKSSIAVELGA